jgi:hypothetical protein
MGLYVNLRKLLPTYYVYLYVHKEECEIIKRERVEEIFERMLNLLKNELRVLWEIEEYFDIKRE